MESIEMYEKLFHDDDLEDLYSLYSKVDREVEAAKGRRLLLVFGGHFLACLIVFFALAKPFGFQLFLVGLLVSAVASSILYYVNLSVFTWLFGKNLADNERREHIELRIQLAQKRQTQNQQ